MGIVDDDVYYQLFLESVFEAEGRFSVVARASSGAEALRWPLEPAPHIILLDVGLPDRSGSSLVAPLLERFPQALVIMLTATADAALILEAIRDGAVGYLLKGGTEESLLRSIREALAGGAPMSPSIARQVLALMRTSPPFPSETTAPEEDPRLRELTERERSVLQRVAEGDSDKEVADALGLARSTVKNTLLSVYAKWRVRTRTEAAVTFTRIQKPPST